MTQELVPSALNAEIVATKSKTAQAYGAVILALCIWREARGESRLAKTAVKHVVLNRQKPGKTFADIILQPRQFSSFNDDDANATKMPRPSDPAWIECCDVVDANTSDPTNGATNYYSVPIKKTPSWAEGRPMCAQIGPFRFFKL